MQIEIHEREPAWTGHKVLAEIGPLLDPRSQLPAYSAAFGLYNKPFISGNEEAAGTAGRVADAKFTVSTRIGLHAANDGLNENPRSEVLPGPLLAFACGFL